MDLNSIMRNIYGENAPQNFDSVSLSGGKINHRRSRVKFLDESDGNQPSPSSIDVEQTFMAGADYSYKANKIFSEFGDVMGFSGGDKGDDKVYPSAEYVPDDGLKKFINEFYLHYLISNIHKNTILIVPSDSTLKSMIDNFKSKLKSENIDPCSPDASRYAAKNELPFKNYIFDVYGKNSPNNEGMPYQVPPDFPQNGTKETLRRTNRLSNVYFFQFESKSSIKVANNEKMSGASTLKFIGKADHECFILKGDIPSAVESKSDNVITMTGGNKKQGLRSYFMSLVRKYDDLDVAAYNFIGSFKDAKKISKYYSGDYIHSAFSILADDANEGLSFEYDPSDETISDFHSELIDNYSPVKSLIKMNKVCEVLPRILKNTKMSKNGLEASKTFVSTLHKMYNTTSAPPFMMKADIATAICKRDNSVQAVRNAFQIMDAVDTLDSGVSDDNSGFGDSYLNSSINLGEKSISSPLVNTIYNAISSSPFIGSLAREYTPIPLYSSSRRRSSSKRLSAFEDGEHLTVNDSDSFQFSILNDGESNGTSTPSETPTSSEMPAETSTSASNLSEGGDIDIKSFF